MHVEILLNNNLAGFMTPAVSRYGNVLYQSWPLGRLRELDPAAAAWFSLPVHLLVPFYVFLPLCLLARSNLALSPPAWYRDVQEWW